MPKNNHNVKDGPEPSEGSWFKKQHEESDEGDIAFWHWLYHHDFGVKQ